MPFIKVHISSLEAPAKKPLLARQLREIMLKTLQLDEKLGQVLLYDTVPQHRTCSSERNSRYVLIEILMHPGKTIETKKALMLGLLQETARILGIDAGDIQCCIQELPPENCLGNL